ncbi:hypothetical protein G7Z17_g4092 [Cylindrodendrum hubeiense]|uniref:Uncharacterized protein n=1 Tax=Cylindrodendrum hubeiense TaxID=595255 RepID=A0A9P5H9G6_9HYPO|nr:hypothetical protein G7Z17_g4092 [Cylindrodendrum hubeiense]
MRTTALQAFAQGVQAGGLRSLFQELYLIGIAHEVKEWEPKTVDDTHSEEVRRTQDVNLLRQAFDELKKHSKSDSLPSLTLRVAVVRNGQKRILPVDKRGGAKSKIVWQCTIRTFNTALQALAMSKLQIKNLNLFNDPDLQQCSIACEQLDEIDWNNPGLTESLAALESLSISTCTRVVKFYKDYYETDDESELATSRSAAERQAEAEDASNFVGLSKLLSLCAGLENLELHYLYIRPTGGPSTISRSWGEKILQHVVDLERLPNLKRCRLRGFTIRETDLLEFIKRTRVRDLSLETPICGVKMPTPASLLLLTRHLDLFLPFFDLTAPLFPPTGPTQQAQADPLSSQTSHRCLLTDSSSALRPQPLPTDDSPDAVNKLPESGSINAILRAHCRTKLYVKPIYWTSDQLRLLGCQFSLNERPPKQRRDTAEPDNTPRVAQDKKASKSQPSRDLIRAARQMCTLSIPGFKRAAMHELLVAHGFQCQKSDQLSFRFSRRTVCSVLTDGVWSLNTAAPSLAYIDLYNLESLRKKRICHSKESTRGNRPVAALRKKKLRHHKPSNDAEDPYILAILIALAQEQRRMQQKQQKQQQKQQKQQKPQKQQKQPNEQKQKQQKQTTSAGEEGHKVSLIGVRWASPRTLYFYTAWIPSTFLDKLDRPSQFSPSRSISVSYHAVSLMGPKAPANLQTRLRRLLDDHKQQSTMEGLRTDDVKQG